jgi:microcystin-dependent protein
MSTPFVAQITMFGGGFAPRHFAYCNGQPMGIAQNAALYSLIGTTYGGDGVTTFNLPNMVSRLPVHFGTGAGLSNYALGQVGGVSTVTITNDTMPMHTHSLNAAKVDATTSTITNSSLPAQPTVGTPYLYASGSTGLTPRDMAAGAVMMAGSSFPHTNMMPSLCVAFIIALQGIFPSRN